MRDSPSPPEVDGRAASDPRMIAAIVASALFMQNLDSAAIATALPAMARDLGEDPVRLGAAITSYLVALTVFIPVSGWVADRFGARRVFMAAIAVFTLASLLCGRASGLGELVAARVLQGLGGAMMVPVGRLLLLRRVRKEELLSAMTWLTVPGLLGPIAGPPLGGFVTEALGWRFIFYLNLPIGLVGLALVAWKVPVVPPGDPGPPDAKGLALLGLALAFFMLGLETAGRGVLPAGVPAAALALGLVLGLAALRHSRRARRPALDLGLLAIPTFNKAVLAGSLFRIGAGVTPFLVPLVLQLGFGRGPAESGLVSFATALGALAMKPLARPILRRFGFRATLVGNAALSAAGIAACATFSAAWPAAAVFVVLALGGLARSLEFTALNTLAFAEVPQARLSAATSFYGTVQQLAPALAVVLATASLEASAALAGRHGLETADFAVGFLAGGLVALAAAPFLARLPADAGAEVAGRERR